MDVRRVAVVIVSPATRSQFDRMGRLNSTTRVVGLDAPAFAFTGGTRELVVWRNHVMLSVMVTDVTDSLSAAKTMARIALGRL